MKIDKNGPNGCWVWTGYCQRRGHGWLGALGLAHRYAWKLLRGELEPGVCLLHHCDNPPCVNPAHLFKGDRRANWQDARDKGHRTVDQLRTKAILTEAEVLEIIRDYRKTGPRRSNVRVLMKRYPHVSQGTIVHAALGRTWKHLHSQGEPQPERE